LMAVITRRPEDGARRYTHFLIIQVLGVSLIVLFLLQSFATFIVFATSMGFIAAPAIAYYNYVAVTSRDMPEDMRPSHGLIVWNWVAVVIMAAFAIAFIYTRVVS